MSGPSAPVRLRLLSTAARGARLSWEVPAQQNGNIRKYQVQYREMLATDAGITGEFYTPHNCKIVLLLWIWLCFSESFLVRVSKALRRLGAGGGGVGGVEGCVGRLLDKVASLRSLWLALCDCLTIVPRFKLQRPLTKSVVTANSGFVAQRTKSSHLCLW